MLMVNFFPSLSVSVSLTHTYKKQICKKCFSSGINIHVNGRRTISNLLSPFFLSHGPLSPVIKTCSSGYDAGHSWKGSSWSCDVINVVGSLWLLEVSHAGVGSNVWPCGLWEAANVIAVSIVTFHLLRLRAQHSVISTHTFYRSGNEACLNLEPRRLFLWWFPAKS